MRTELTDRLIWSLYRRHKIARSVECLTTSVLSYANGATRFEGNNRLYDRAVVGDSVLGSFTYLAPDARVMYSAVGRYCSIGPGTLIGGLGVHPSKWLSSHPVFFSTKGQSGKNTFADRDYIDELPRVTIGSDVWVGARAIVLDGLKIGDGAIIGAGAVVTKDVEPYAIVGGVPAKKIRMRFDVATVSMLLEIRWWNWPTDRLKQAAAIFRTGDATALGRLFQEEEQGNTGEATSR